MDISLPVSVFVPVCAVWGGIFIGDKDLTEKLLESNNDVFSDIVNVLLFGGEQVVGENELVDTRTFSAYEDSNGMLHEQQRDVAKLWKSHNVRLALYGIENQTDVERLMPLRIFGYEGAAYREQLKLKEKYPVVTIVLYFGTGRRWTAPKTLKKLIRMPKFIKKYVNDITVNVFEVAWLSDEVINRFTSDFRIVANFFKNKRINKDYISDDKTEMKHVEDVLALISSVTKDKRYRIDYEQNKEVRSMCQVYDNAINKGIAIGKEQGIELGKEQGIELGKEQGIELGMRQLIQNMAAEGMSNDMLCKYTRLSREQIRALL